MENGKRILKEGEFTNGYFKSRINRNKNILIVTSGATGSGKSYVNLRMAELWYKEKFNQPFPIENVCFSNGEVMKRLASGTLKKGELLIPEEVGVNLSSVDFQSRTSKMINFTMQSFRSMNIGLLMNLPVLSMLNKSCRQLIHAHFITVGINPVEKTCKIKPFLHQLNQASGKSYWKYPRIKFNNKTITLQRISYCLPSPELIRAYEAKKQKFLSDLTAEYSAEYDKIEQDKIKKMSRNDLTKVEQEVFDNILSGLNVTETAKKLGKGYQTVLETRHRIERKGFSLENKPFKVLNPIPTPF